MDIAILIPKVIASLLLPPGGMLLMMLVGALLFRRYYQLGRNLMLLGFGLLWIASLPISAVGLARMLESVPAITTSDLTENPAQAIVVLGGGSRPAASEYTGPMLNKASLERITYAAFLQQQTQLPILVSGGAVHSEQGAVDAHNMQRVLQQLFHCEVRWIEDRSRNTWENAEYSAAILRAAQIQHVLLVTHALHMPRALAAFAHSGLHVIPAPTGFVGDLSSQPLIITVLPSAQALQLNRRLGHELLGRIWYWLRYP